MLGRVRAACRRAARSPCGACASFRPVRRRRPRSCARPPPARSRHSAVREVSPLESRLYELRLPGAQRRVPSTRSRVDGHAGKAGVRRRIARTGGAPIPPAPARVRLRPWLALSALLHALTLAAAGHAPPRPLATPPLPLAVAWVEDAVPPTRAPAAGSPQPPPAVASGPLAGPASATPDPASPRMQAPRPPPRPVPPARSPATPGAPAPAAAAPSPLPGAPPPAPGVAGSTPMDVGWPGAAAGGHGARGGAALPRIQQRAAPAYPARARRAGREGRSEIALRIGRDGRVVATRLHRSAGDPSLDEAALAAVHRWRFVPSPPGVDWSATWFLVPIEFRLE